MAQDFRIPDVAKDMECTIQDHVYARLRNAIMVGAIPPGTSLTFKGLAADMGLSPTPVREAIRRLSSENAVEILGNRRLRIPAMTAERFEDLAGLRILLEIHAAKRALRHVSEANIQTIKEIDDQMDDSIEASDLDRLINLNYQFHTALYALDPNQATLPLIRSVWLQLGPFHRTVIEDVKEYYVVDRHKEMLAALRARDTQALITAVRADIEDGVLKSGMRALTQPAQV